MSVVTVVRLILNVSYRDRNGFCLVTNRTAFSDIGIVFSFSQTLGSLNRKDRSCCCSFTMVNVSNGADIYVRFCPLKFFLGHTFLLPVSITN